jgi:hypothetical protein
MSTSTPKPLSVRCGPFGQGVYAQLPTHHFTRRVEVERAPGLQGDVLFWACTHCPTTVSAYQLPAAEQHPCDGRPRCAICNAPISYPFPRVSGTLLGVLCRDCHDAREHALTVPLPTAP